MSAHSIYATGWTPIDTAIENAEPARTALDRETAIKVEALESLADVYDEYAVESENNYRKTANAEWKRAAADWSRKAEANRAAADRLRRRERITIDGREVWITKAE